MFATIPVEDLRVGMHICLEGGWLSHPFPLSSFRIVSAEQIATIRGLGLAQVAWVPEKSDPEVRPGFEAAPAEAATATDTAATTAPEVAVAPAAAPTAEPAAAPSVRPAVPTSAAEVLARQRDSLQRCERRYAEAARHWRAAHDAVSALPQRARAGAEALTDAILAEMAAAGDIGIRLLGTQAGDRAAAHALNVTVISLLIARSFGLSATEMGHLGLGALLHDMGKTDLPERARHADPLHGHAETAAYREHVARGVTLGRRMGLPEAALQVLAQHHEHADGSGFPAALRGEAQAMGARIVTIVNRYDNLCNPSLSQRGLTPHEAVSTLFAQGRGSYDRTVLNAFIRMMGVYPAGSLVQLTDDRYALVMSVNSSRPLKPRVLVHDDKVAREQALILNLEQVPELGIRRSLPPARVPPVALHYLDPRPRVAYYFEPLSAPSPAAEPAPAADRHGACA